MTTAGAIPEGIRLAVDDLTEPPERLSVIASVTIALRRFDRLELTRH